MYYVSKRMEIAGAHRLDLPYSSKCSELHGHNWIITVYCQAERLNDCGMVIDFILIKKLIHDQLDHKFINDVLGDINPTAENMAKWICDLLNSYFDNPHYDPRYSSYVECYQVDVQESEGNVATYVKEVTE